MNGRVRSKTAAALTAVRATRMAPAATLTEAAEAAGVSSNALQNGLRLLNGRGGCAAVAAQAAAKADRREHRRGAVAHRVCPPSAVRAAAELDEFASVGASGRGVAAWTAQRLGRFNPRRAMANLGLSDDDNSELWARADNFDADAMLVRLTYHHMASIRIKTQRVSPPWIIKMFAVGGDTDTLINAACNSRCPPEMLAALSTNDIVDVRHAVAWNRGCPRLQLERLAVDPVPAVHEAAAEALERRSR